MAEKLSGSSIAIDRQAPNCHIICENTIGFDVFAKIFSSVGCSDIVHFFEKRNFPASIYTRIKRKKLSDRSSIEQIYEILEALDEQFHSYYVNKNQNIHFFLCTNAISSLQALIPQIANYLALKAHFINHSAWRKQTTYCSLSTYHVDMQAEYVTFFPLVATYRTDILSAYLAQCLEEPELVTATKIRQSLSLVTENLETREFSKETVKNYLMEIKKQFRGYLGFTEHYRGSYIKPFRLSLKK